MKKSVVAIVVALFASAALFANGAAETSPSAAGATTGPTELKVGATPLPHAALLNLVKDQLAQEGVNLKVIEFTDYVTPNEALASGELDANYFQHLPYLETYNREHGTNLVSAGGIHIEPLALYSKKFKSLDTLPDGASIAIPNDPTNEGRALLLLQSAGLVKLKDNAGLEATPFDIATNPKKLKFQGN
jgi:D-methionine transport system substrate-binding protein